MAVENELLKGFLNFDLGAEPGGAPDLRKGGQKNWKIFLQFCFLRKVKDVCLLS